MSLRLEEMEWFYLTQPLAAATPTLETSDRRKFIISQHFMETTITVHLYKWIFKPNEHQKPKVAPAWKAGTLTMTCEWASKIPLQNRSRSRWSRSNSRAARRLVVWIRFRVPLKVDIPRKAVAPRPRNFHGNLSNKSKCPLTAGSKMMIRLTSYSVLLPIPVGASALAEASATATKVSHFISSISIFHMITTIFVINDPFPTFFGLMFENLSPSKKRACPFREIWELANPKLTNSIHQINSP